MTGISWYWLFCLNVWTCFCFFTHFVACWCDLNNKLKTFPNGKRHSTELVLRAPGVILKCVENHFVPSVKSGVHVHGYVAGLRRVAAQVDDKPAGPKRHESHKQSVSFRSELESNWSQGPKPVTMQADLMHCWSFSLFTVNKLALRPQIFLFWQGGVTFDNSGTVCFECSLTFNHVKKAAPPRLRLLKVFPLLFEMVCKRKKKYFTISEQNMLLFSYHNVMEKICIFTDWHFLYSHGDILRNWSLNVEVSSLLQSSTNVFHEGNALYKSQSVNHAEPELQRRYTLGILGLKKF